MKNPASSELHAAVALLAELREAGLLLISSRPATQTPPPVATSRVPPAAPAAEPRPPGRSEGPPSGQLAPVAASPKGPSRLAPPAASAYSPSRQPVYRAERVRQLLADLCKRGGFSGAILADRSGLALAEFNTPFDVDSLAAFASVVGDTLEQADRLLGKRDANNLALDINYVEKIVVRKFLLAHQPAYLLVICAQSIDERSEIELSIDLVESVLAEEN